ncbi:hypothetical protein [Luteipulveratus flavus]|uniref:Uncharacterized protein n=1 Tax=Luteipulveratus flavus TaxID=3031728 RepID=A0ABT6C4R5_9MICO|nr:hypothetical protein [Luteipulveratus sp. YIM 133296]MDF8263870.1 hypothetical protein [Luteipulveratus sp. YIM 133296]
MPDDVMARIQSALQREQDDRAGSSENVTPLVGRPTAPSADGASAVPGGRRHGRARWLAPVAGLGAAAAIAVGALGVTKAMNNDEAPPAAAPTASATAPDGSGSVNPMDKVSIQNSGRDYTAAGLTTEAAALKTQSGSIDPIRAEAIGLGPAATARGLLDCLKGLGPQLVTADRIAADFGMYEGKPAIVVVITDNGKSNVWVFSRQCSQGSGKIAGPTQLT